MDVNQTAQLANLKLTPEEAQKFSTQLAETLQTIEVINQLDTTGVSPTAQVTGLTNVLRKDEIDPDRILTSEQALSQAVNRQGNYFVVPAVLDQN
jgi:aspartyl-tRNA(Asn)/glutamyl-tRNA(Gln) amidotransferase subunit C